MKGDRTVAVNDLNFEGADLESILGNKFRILGPLGHGPRSRIFSAQRVEDSFPVAVKVFRYGFDKVEERRVALMMGTLTDCLKIDHQSVVRVLGCGCDRDSLIAWLVMEHVDGPTLRDYLNEVDSVVTIGRVLQFLGQVAEGLDEIHAHGLIHRDIKPDNIFISRTDLKPKIGDFGLALTLLDFTDRLTVGRDAFGTPAYVAPEQIIGTTFDYRVDIYAYAMTIYNILTREFAYEYHTERDLLLAHMHQEPIPPSRRNLTWPESLDAALMKSLSKNPDRRHRNAVSLFREVEESLATFTPFRVVSLRGQELQGSGVNGVTIKGVEI